jgi:hypothetical protein
VIRNIVVGLAVLGLSGCVYYVPYEATATEPWVDETVVYEEPAIVYESYLVSPYYPWASLDYFYLGNNYYRPYSGFSFSFGFFVGGGWYPPYYYNPYYYSAWYPPYYGFPYPYPYYGAGYDRWYHHYPHHAYRSRYDDDHYGDHGGGHGGGGIGSASNARTAGPSSLDRHVPLQRQPVPAQSLRTQPGRTQPAGNVGYYGRTRPVEPLGLPGAAGQRSQPRTVQPGRNQAAPARTGMPSGMSRPVPTENSGGKPLVVRQAPATPVYRAQPAPQPSFKQPIAPQSIQAAPAAEQPRRPDGGFQRSEPRREDGGDGFNRRDRDDR